jgi:hypothetical protein
MVISGIECDSVTLDSKPNLVSKCGKAARVLLNTGCDYVMIVWDLFPPWREKGQRPCRREDREAILESLSQEDVDTARVRLICIREELEAWLLADGRALSRFLSTPTHPVTVRGARYPDRVRQPKTRLTRLFQEHIGRPYRDLEHAHRIVQFLSDLSQIRRDPAFARFEKTLREWGN